MVELVSVGFVIVADQISREWRQREVADFYTAKTISGEILGNSRHRSQQTQLQAD